MDKGHEILYLITQVISLAGTLPVDAGLQRQSGFINATVKRGMKKVLANTPTEIVL